jgi:hypothetical protein
LEDHHPLDEDNSRLPTEKEEVAADKCQTVPQEHLEELTHDPGDKMDTQLVSYQEAPLFDKEKGLPQEVSSKIRTESIRSAIITTLDK